MSRPTQLKLKLALAILLVFILACDTGTLLPFGAPTPTPNAGPSQFPLTFGTEGAYRPSSAGWIAVVSQGNLWLIHPDGSGIKQITQNATPSASTPNTGFTLRWSPDGKMLGYAVGGVLTVLDIGSLQTTVRAYATAGGFDWSGNGQQIVYDGPVTADSSGKPVNNGLWVVDVDSGQTRQMFQSSPAYPVTTRPLWSTDSTRVIFSEPPGAGSGGIHLLSLDTGKITDLVPGSSPNTLCSWAPNAMIIACVDPNPGAGQAPSVILLDEAGTESANLAIPGAHYHPRLGPWASDGKRLALIYTSDPNGSQEMTDILSLDTGDFKTVGAGRALSWSPDGRWIALETSSAGTDQPITIVNTTSGLTSTLTNASSMAWQPGSDVNAAPTPSFCMNSAVGFVHMKPKGYFLTFCLGPQHITYPSLEKGVYAVGGRGSFFIYVSNSGYVFAAHMGDPALTRIGDVRTFIAIRTPDMEPNFQIRFIAGYPDIVQVVELTFGEKETFTLPRRITAP